MPSSGSSKPLSVAEQQRKKRKKLKREGKYEEYNAKHVKAVQKYIKKLANCVQALPVKEQAQLVQQSREKDQLRKQKSWNKARDVHTWSPFLEKSPCSYSHKSSLNQAINRVKKSLPASPRKRNTVVRKLHEEFITAVNNKPLASKIHLGSLPTSTIEMVNNF